MNLTPRTALGHILGALRSVRVCRGAALGTIPAAALLTWPGTGTAQAESGGKGSSAGGMPWYVPPAVTLLAAAVTASATWLTARWNRTQQRRDRSRDCVERREREARFRAELQQRERRAAARTVWTPYFQRIEEMLLAVGALQHEAQQRRLHDDDAAAPELRRLHRTARQYAEHAPGVLPAALQELAGALAGIGRNLLPEAAELDRIGLRGNPSTACLPLFARAGEQARAADRLSVALTNAYRALHQEWLKD